MPGMATRGNTTLRLETFCSASRRFYSGYAYMGLEGMELAAAIESLRIETGAWANRTRPICRAGRPLAKFEAGNHAPGSV